MKYVLNVLPIYELGKREKQEDSLFPRPNEVTPSTRLFILCDGMGGHDAGEVASQTVCEAMGRCLLHTEERTEAFDENDFKAALTAAYDALDEKDSNTPKKMGTTLTFARFHRGGCFLAHIGDSRIYHIRPSQGILFQTRDHSLVNALFDAGELSYEELKTSRQKNIITRAMQPHLEHRFSADIKHVTDIRPNDYFFMCSDGMLEEMENPNLVNILSDEQATDEEKRRILVKVSESSHDNHSAFIIHVLDVVQEEGDRQLLAQFEEKDKLIKRKTAPELSATQV